MRLLHTADWQIGMKAKQAGAKAEAVRNTRLETAQDVVRLAGQHGADVLILAGDTFEDNAVSSVLVRRVVDILSASPCPVFVLPGNHDPMGAGSVFTSRAWQDAEPRVRVLRTCAPVEIGPAVLLPCPCEAKRSNSDPTLRIPLPDESGRIRVGVAHGSLRDHAADIQEDDYPIAANAAERARLDYLALGHWHSTRISPAPEAPRMAYPGTHEQTTFGETDPGNCLLVSIEHAGGPIRVDKLKTGRLAWITLERNLASDTDVDALRAEVEQLPNPERTLLRLRIDGLTGPDGFAQLRELADVAVARFFHAELQMEGVLPRPDNQAGWLAMLPAGVAQTVAERLLAEAATGPDTVRRTATHALARLVMFAREASS